MRSLIAWLLRDIDAKLDRVLAALANLKQEIATMDAATKTALDNLTAKVTALTTVEGGLAVVVDTAAGIINGIPAQIAAALANAPAGTDPTLVASLAALGDSIGAAGTDLAAKKDELTTALTANTPVVPSPVSPVSAPTT
jgi:hypothetical protein